MFAVPLLGIGCSVVGIDAVLEGNRCVDLGRHEQLMVSQSPNVPISLALFDSDLFVVM